MGNMKESRVSVVVPVYNEERVIASCLDSLQKQEYRNLEIIVVDDGSTDETISQVRSVRLLKQKHQGPGAARNLGAKKATGEILVFVDADMEFAPNFITKLVQPIIHGNKIGTFSKDEFLLNKDNIWARLWNLNLGRPEEKMHPDNYPDQQHVFRAILKKEFNRVGGFDTTVGYTDDWTLARKLGVLAVVAPGAKFYHRNPESLSEIWSQARWIGKNEFLTKSLVRRFYNLYRYCPIWAVFNIFDPPKFIFKTIYNSAVFTSVVLSFIGEEKSK